MKKWVNIVGIVTGSLVLIGCENTSNSIPNENGEAIEDEERLNVEELRVSEDYFELSGNEVTEEQLDHIFEHSDYVDEENGYRIEAEFHLVDFESNYHWNYLMEGERIRETQEEKEIQTFRNGESTFEGDYYMNLDQVSNYTYQRLNQGEWEAVMRPELYSSSPSYMSVMRKMPDNLDRIDSSIEEGKLILSYVGPTVEELYTERTNRSNLPAGPDRLLSYPYVRARDDEGEVIFESEDRYDLEEATVYLRAEFDEESYFLERLYYELEQEDFLHIYEVEFSQWDEIEEIRIPEDVVEEAVEVMPY